MDLRCCETMLILLLGLDPAALAAPALLYTHWNVLLLLGLPLSSCPVRRRPHRPAKEKRFWIAGRRFLAFVLNDDIDDGVCLGRDRQQRCITVRSTTSLPSLCCHHHRLLRHQQQQHQQPPWITPSLLASPYHSTPVCRTHSACRPPPPLL